MHLEHATVVARFVRTVGKRKVNQQQQGRYDAGTMRGVLDELQPALLLQTELLLK